MEENAFVGRKRDNAARVTRDMTKSFALVFVLVATASRIIAAASALATLNLATLPMAAAEPAVRLTAHW